MARVCNRQGRLVRFSAPRLHATRKGHGFDINAEEVARVAAWTHEALLRVLSRHGRSLEGLDESPDDIVHDQPVLASCYSASTADLQLLGSAPGLRTDKLARPVRLVPSPTEPLAEVGGVNIHAKVLVDGRDRRRLERVCRYIARPPRSQERLELQPDGRVRYRFKSAWKDGTHAVLLDPLDFIARLCALIPPPRFHMLRYHGVLAGHAKARADVVPGRDTPPPPPQLELFELSPAPSLEPAPRPSRHPWPWLLSRVFAVDIMTCPRCQAPMRLRTIATEPDDITRLLRGQSTEPRTRAPPRRPAGAQLELQLDVA